MLLLYSLSISLYNLAVLFAKPFNKKAGLLVNGRANTAAILKNFKRDKSRKLAWFHCASLGEFEQARPVIERLKKERDIQVAISFFSPSGYEVRKNYETADVVFYLPSDSPSNARMVLDALKPDLVFFVKYEIWIHYISAITKRNLSLYLLSATFRPSHIYFKWYGKRLKRALQSFDVIFTQDQASLTLLKNNDIPNAVFSNDTRYDRVYEQAFRAKELPLVKAFKGAGKVLILGSSYAQEEAMAISSMHEHGDLKMIIAPHNIDNSRITEIQKMAEPFNPVKYSEAAQAGLSKARVLIIDNIGLLSSLYQYADVAFIGGGFDTKGIHNTLEAATFGMPVLIGPNNHERFPEVQLLKEHQVLFTVSTKAEFAGVLNRFLCDQTFMLQTRLAAKNLVQNNTGATDLILGYLK